MYTHPGLVFFASLKIHASFQPLLFISITNYSQKVKEGQDVFETQESSTPPAISFPTEEVLFVFKLNPLVLLMRIIFFFRRLIVA